MSEGIASIILCVQITQMFLLWAIYDQLTKNKDV